MLVEVLVALTITALLLALAVPSFRSVIRSQRVRAVAQALQADMFWARGEAMRRGAAVVLRFEPATDCPFTPAANEQRCRWSVVAGPSGDQLLRSYTAPADIAITHSAGSVATRFDRHGNNMPLGGRYLVAAAQAAAGDTTVRTLCLNAGGRIRTSSRTAC